MELVVVSGKGGTGKTTVAVSLSKLAQDVIRVDCDVDASNLFLFYGGKTIAKKEFLGERPAVIDKDLCIECGKCEEFCRFDAIKNYTVNEYKCEGCGGCRLVCPQNAISLHEQKSADVYVTESKEGKIIWAEMEVGSEGSGKLVTLLRQTAKEYVENNQLIVVDGSPGIGCQVIASITGADMVLIVTEPTISGFEDLKRVSMLCNHFNISPKVCINKCDLNKQMCDNIKEYSKENNIEIVGSIPYDDNVIKSINECKPIIDYKDSKATKHIISMWEKLKKYVNGRNEDYENCSCS